jgi:hypothetical protein
LEGNLLSLINFGKEEIFKALKDMSPYLTRIYAILKQSGISLKKNNVQRYINLDAVNFKL